MASLDGINCTVICYGSTGTGKSHTIGLQQQIAGSDDEGIIPRAIRDIFEQLKDGMKISFSQLEIYQDKVYDLLQKPTRKQETLEVREDASGQVFVPGLTCTAVSSPSGLLSLITKGKKNRKVRETERNSQSSRSHAVLQVFIEQHQRNGTVVKSKVSFVDLAGSERWGKDAQMGEERVSELIMINSSLGALISVVAALSDTSRKPKHVPYRDSKLTHLLQDSLGGNSILSLILTLCPAADSYAESVRTLRFGDRASALPNNPVVNISQDVNSILDFKEREIKRLRGLLADLTSPSGTDNARAVSVAMEEMRSFSNQGNSLLQELEEAKRALASERLMRQGLERELNRQQYRPQSEASYDKREAVAGPHSHYHLSGLTPPATSGGEMEPGSWRPTGNAYDFFSPLSRSSTASNLSAGRAKHGSYSSYSSPMHRAQAQRKNGHSKLTKIEEAIAAIKLRLSDLTSSSPKKSVMTKSSTSPMSHQRNHEAPHEAPLSPSILDISLPREAANECMVSPVSFERSAIMSLSSAPAASSGWGRSAFVSSSPQSAAEEGRESRPASSSSYLPTARFGRSSLALTPTKPRDSNRSTPGSRISSARSSTHSGSRSLGAATMIYILGTTQPSHRAAKIGSRCKVDAEKLAKNGMLYESLA